MHMSDSLISPSVGGAMWAAAGGLIGFSARQMRRSLDDRRVPLMGVLGAFVFAAQMINFTIPGTGSSGHLGGGLLLAILLGPYAAFITITSILAVQALFFADGGLLALGCNVINMGVFPCFVAYPLIYAPIARGNASPRRIALASTLAAVVGLQLGALAVVFQTTASGISELPFGKFALAMLPIHLAIGLVEGLITAAVVSLVARTRPEILDLSTAPAPAGPRFGRVVVGLLVAATITGGAICWFASEFPDGLERSVQRVSGQDETAAPADGAHAVAARVQERTAFLPDYELPPASDDAHAAPAAAAATANPEETSAWGRPNVGKTLSGLVGGAITLLLAGALAWLLKRRSAVSAEPGHASH